MNKVEKNRRRGREKKRGVRRRMMMSTMSISIIFRTRGMKKIMMTFEHRNSRNREMWKGR